MIVPLEGLDRAGTGPSSPPRRRSTCSTWRRQPSQWPEAGAQYAGVHNCCSRFAVDASETEEGCMIIRDRQAKGCALMPRFARGEFGGPDGWQGR
jgi:hypothetical protein